MEPTPEKYRVLIVDDISKNIQVLGNILSNQGLKVGFAMNGKQALQIVTTQPIDLILLDISMPEMDGYQVCQQLKANPATKEIPVIFLTAKVQVEDIVKGFEVGAVDYVTKPFNPAVLLSRVFTHLELKRHRDTMSKYIETIDLKNQQLKEVNASKDKLFSIISHDLRTPIGNIKSVMEMLVKGEVKEEEKTYYLNLASKASIASYTLVENLLAWSGSQMGRLKFNPNNVDINFFVNDNFELLDLSSKNKGVNLVSKVPLDTYVYADENMITAVFRNLISNAIKFSKKEGTIEISVKPVEINQEGFIETCIADDGVGVKPEDMDKLFDNKHFTTYGTDNEKGAGLGLMLCKEFVEMNGGTIRFESEYGHGTRFYITLPKFR